MQSIECTDLEFLLTRVSRSQYFSKANISKMVHLRDKVNVGC